jgi:predicted transport protein
MTRVNIKTGKIIEKQEFTGPNPEKQLQQYIEKYLLHFFHCHYLKNFYKIPGGEIDTLAVSEDGNPCLIEYKHKKDETIINQIVFYYDWLHERSSRFEFERVVKENVRTKDIKIDWSKIKLVCVAKEYTKWDISLIKHLDTDIECFTYTYHENELDVHLDPIVNQYKKQKPFDVNSGSSTKSVTLEDHRERADKMGKVLLDSLREEILSLGDNITEGYTPEYIKYVVDTTFTAVHVRKNWLVIQLKVDEMNFKDPNKLSKDISDRNWSVTKEIKFDKLEDLKGVLDLIKQAYKYQ